MSEAGSDVSAAAGMSEGGSDVSAAGGMSEGGSDVIAGYLDQMRAGLRVPAA
jgi:hypothetical protein